MSSIFYFYKMFHLTPNSLKIQPVLCDPHRMRFPPSSQSHRLPVSDKVLASHRRHIHIFYLGLFRKTSADRISISFQIKFLKFFYFDSIKRRQIHTQKMLLRRLPMFSANAILIIHVHSILWRQMA